MGLQIILTGAIVLLAAIGIRRLCNDDIHENPAFAVVIVFALYFLGWAGMFGGAITWVWMG